MKHVIVCLCAGILVIFAAGGLVLTGCSDDDPASSHGTAPEIPPQSTFMMDYSDFEIEQTGTKKESVVMTKANWGYAAMNVAVWNTVLTVTLVVPVAAFVEAFQHNAVWQPEDNSWEWAYSFYAGGLLHTARLNGRVVDDQVQWNMYISKQDAYTNFQWFTGEHDVAATEGEWLLNKDPDDPTAFIRIDWHRNTTESTADIKYTNVIPDDDENGGYIAYGITDDDTHDRFYEIYNKGLDNLTDIEWNYTSKAGRIMDEIQFEDTEWHCWDEILDDVECPVIVE